MPDSTILANLYSLSRYNQITDPHMAAFPRSFACSPFTLWGHHALGKVGQTLNYVSLLAQLGVKTQWELREKRSVHALLIPASSLSPVYSKRKMAHYSFPLPISTVEVLSTFLTLTSLKLGHISWMRRVLVENSAGQRRSESHVKFKLHRFYLCLSNLHPGT